jgi:hypothetical protein
MFLCDARARALAEGITLAGFADLFSQPVVSGSLIGITGPAVCCQASSRCSPSPHRSPFDLEAVHIFYSPGVEFHDLEALGWALLERLREVGEGQELCDRLEGWLAAARISRGRSAA